MQPVRKWSPSLPHTFDVSNEARGKRLSFDQVGSLDEERRIFG
jgi:hypothetical protein